MQECSKGLLFDLRPRVSTCWSVLELLLKVTQAGFFLPLLIKERIRSKTKVLCSQDMRERQIWKPATRMVGDKCWHVSRSSTENSLAIWTFKRAWKRWISQTAVTLVWKISKEIFVPQSEEGHSSASLEFIPSVYGGKALPASQAEHTPADTHTHTHTQLFSSIISHQWTLCQKDGSGHLSFPVGCNEHRLLDTGQPP